MNDSLATSYPLAVEPFARGRVAPFADADRRRPIVVVLGMHRSGTSLCAHILSAMGIDMADEIREHDSNARGHWERWEIVEFHDRILGLFNRDYYGPFHDFSLPVAWWADPRVSVVKREIVAFLERRMGDGYFGFKDPRTVRLMPVWHQIFNDLKLAPKIVFCLRNPAQVARSVKARDGLDLEIGEYRWLTHLVDFFRYSGDFDICTVEYERWFTDPFANFEQLKKFLDVPWQQSESDLGLVLSGIVDPALRHDSADHREAGQPLVRTLYALAKGGHPDGGACKTSDIITQHINFQQLQEPFQRAFENISGIAAKLPQVEQEAADLRTAVAERDALIEAANGRTSTAEARLAEAVAAAAKLPQVEQEAADLRAAVAERDALIEAANGRTSAAEARLAEAVAAAEAQRVHFAEIVLERDAHAAALENARAELGSSQSALADAESGAKLFRSTLADREAALVEASSRANEIAGLLQTAEAELATRDAAILQAEQEVQDRAAAVEAMGAALTGLREDLARSENEATALRTALNEREAIAQEADARAKASETRLAGSLAEVEAQRLQLTVISGDLSDRTTTAAALQAEIEILRGTLGLAEQRGQVHAAAAATAQAESAVLRDAVARAELENVEAGTVAEAVCAEIASSRIALACAEREAQDRAAAGDAMRAEINSLRSALAAIERHRHEGEAATATLQGEIATLHQALAEAEKRRQQAEAATAALQGETGALHQALAEAEQRRLQGEAAAAALQGETAALHQGLADTEQRRQQAEATTAALQAQVSSLHGELAVAREVGRAALASLRIEPSTTPEVPRKTGWLALVLRPFGFRARLPSPLAG